jgi:hypothetical protein
VIDGLPLHPEPSITEGLASMMYVGMSRALDLLVVCADPSDLRRYAGEGVSRRLGIWFRYWPARCHASSSARHHAIVPGTLAAYSVNLGSGVVHRQPGASVCIVPVSAQHRERIFLPFVDDDPRTAEVISEVLMLARDDKIKTQRSLSSSASHAVSGPESHCQVGLRREVLTAASSCSTSPASPEASTSIRNSRRKTRACS